MQNKVKNKPTSVSAKSAAKERAAQAAKQQQQQQQIILAIGAVILLIVVIGVIVVASRPPEAIVPSEATTRYADIPSGMTNDPKYPIQFPYLGNPNAPVKLEEIASFSCPICKSYHDSTIVNLMDKIKAGDVQYIYMYTTLTGDYPPLQVQNATAAGVCAAQQGKFWQMQETLYDWQGKYGTSTGDVARLTAGANALGLDTAKFSACMNDAATRKYIDDSNTYISQQRKMLGTPSVFLYTNGTQVLPPNPDPRLTEGSVASLSVGDLRGIIESAVAAKKS